MSKTFLGLIVSNNTTTGNSVMDDMVGHVVELEKDGAGYISLSRRSSAHNMELSKKIDTHDTCWFWEKGDVLMFDGDTSVVNFESMVEEGKLTPAQYLELTSKRETFSEATQERETRTIPVRRTTDLENTF